MTKDKTADALAVLQSLTLGDIDAQIQDVETRIREFCGPLEKQLDSLRQLRRVIDLRENGKPARKPRDKPVRTASSDASSGTSGGMIAQRARTYLLANGPMKVASLASALGVEYQSVYAVLTKSPFKKLNTGEYGV